MSEASPLQLRTADEAIAHRGAMMASVGPIPVLAADVGERLAIRDPSGSGLFRRLAGPSGCIYARVQIPTFPGMCGTVWTSTRQSTTSGV